MVGIRRVATLLAILLAVCVVTPVNAAGGGIEVEISAADSTISRDAGVWVSVTYTNTSATDQSILRWRTPASGLEAPLFDVALDGDKVPYIGKLVKRAPPSAADYLTIPAGQSLTYRVDLATAYAFTKTGRYTVGYNSEVPQAKALVSNELTLRVAGRRSPPAALPATTYVGCTPSRQADLATALASADTYAATSKTYFTSSRSGPRYAEWFGAMDAGRYATVKNHFEAMSSAITTAIVTFDCSTCTTSAYAYVYPNRHYEIFLCGSFWSAPNTGTDSKAGTLIHELSHFTVLGGTDDYAYGQSNARSLALNNPAQAVMNADSHEYFAENTPVKANGPVLSADSTNHSFGSFTVGGTTAPKTFTITNTGDSNLVTGTLNATGPFAVSTDCNGKSIVAAGTCTFTATFTPTSSGPQTGSVSIPSNTLLTWSISLSGTGVSPGVDLSPSNHDFGEQQVGTTSAATTFRVTNTSNVPVTFGTLAASAGFEAAWPCNATLQVGSSCDIPVTFTPTTAGLTTGKITIPSTSLGSPHTINVSGVGVQPTVALSTSSHDFGAVNVGSRSAPRAFTITNSGKGTLRLGVVTVTGPFSVDTSCDGVALPPNGSCAVQSTFSPVTPGTASGSITIPGNGTGLHSISLTGVGATAPAPAAQISLSSRSLDFGKVALNGAPVTASVTVTSSGDAPASITSITSGSPFAVDESGCRSASLQPQQSCTFQVSFQPAAPGAQSGEIRVVSTAAESPVIVSATGVGFRDPAPVKVTTKAVARGSRMLVRVLPDRGAAWRFQVQKRAGGDWSTLAKTYKVRGVRRVDLPKGTYRVVVDAIPDYAGGVSKAVRLSR